MFIAHLPAGYLLGKATAKLSGLRTKQLVMWTAIGSLLPDADLLYFYLVDNQSTHHRHYVSHWPITWITLLALSVILLRWRPVSASPFWALASEAYPTWSLIVLPRQSSGLLRSPN